MSGQHDLPLDPRAAAVGQAMIEERGFQMEAIESLAAGLRAGHLRQVLSMPTGAGKTATAAIMAARAAAKGKTCLFIVDRIELVGQAVATFLRLGLRVGVLRADETDYSRHDDIIVASIQTIRTRSAPDWVELVFIDEAHILHKAHTDLMTQWDRIPFVGLSATPLRAGLGKWFTNLVRGPSVAWLTEQGYLVPARAFAPAAEAVMQATASVGVGTTTHGRDFKEDDLAEAVNTKLLVGDIVQTWRERGEDRPTLCFAVNIAHSKAIRDDFEAAGVRIVHLDAYTDADERRLAIAGFRSREIRILTSVNVLGIGFDVPDAACLILARPTLSEALHMQQMGRGIRQAAGKTDCILLDHSGNTLRFGLPIHFTVPDLDDGVSASAGERKKKDKLPFVTCSFCGAVMEKDESTCMACGLDRPDRRQSVAIEYAAGDLVELGVTETTDDVIAEMEKRQHFYRCALGYALINDKKPGMAFFLTKERFQGFAAPRTWLAMGPLDPPPDVVRWIRNRRTYHAIRQQRSH